METAEVDDATYNIIINTEIVVFGLLAVDFLFRLLFFSIQKKTISYLISFKGIIDVFASIPIVFILIDSEDFFFLKIIFGVISFLKIARFSAALSVFKDVIINERKSLLASLYLMFCLTFCISTILYFIERNINPNGFGSIIESMWWSIVTLATVGYGDVVPITNLGKIIGAISAIVGLGMFALPAGILANGFAQELAKIKFITSWNLVSKVPIFKHLDKGTISEIASLLFFRRFSKNEVIIKHGDIGNAMYFIIDGEVEICKPTASSGFFLKKGDFFGEISLLKDIPRTATVTAKNRCEMLELTKYDLQKILKSKPEIIKSIENIANERFDF
jgi:voltage-gated potassium channel